MGNPIFKNSRLHVKFLGMLVVFSLISCYKDTDNTTVILPQNNPATLIDTKLSGKLQDSDGNLKSNCTLDIDDQLAEVDHGYFFIDLSKVNKFGQIIKIYENGILTGYANTILLENDWNYIDLNTFDLPHTHVINKNDKTIVKIDDDYQLEIPKDNFTLHGESYTGEIIFKYHYLNNQNVFDQLGKHAIDESDKNYAMDIKWALHYWYESENGQKLDSPDGKITLDVSPDVANFDWNTVSYDFKSNRWKINADITFENEISGDGMIAIARTEPGDYCEGTITVNELPFSFKKLEFRPNSLIHLNRFTTQKGRWQAFLPSNQACDIYTDNTCDTKVSNILVKDQEKYINTLNNEELNLVQVKPIIVNCNGNPISDIPMLINNGENSVFYDASLVIKDGIWIQDCGEISGIDIPESGSQIVEGQVEDADGTFVLCEDIDEGYSYSTIGEDTKIYDNFIFKIENNRMVFSSVDGKFKVFVRGLTEGDYPESSVNLSINDADFGSSGYFIQCENSVLGCGINECSVSHVTKNNEDFIRLKISGNVWIQKLNTSSATTSPISAIVMCKR